MTPSLTLANIVRQIENHPTASGDAPTTRIEISNCGQLSHDDPILTAEATVTDGDSYEDFPDDEDRDVQNPQVALGIAKEIREIGNKLFKEGKTEIALEKYQSRKLPFFFFSGSRPQINVLLPQNPSVTSTSIP
jgi:hypothetical protein